MTTRRQVLKGAAAACAATLIPAPTVGDGIELTSIAHPPLKVWPTVKCREYIIGYQRWVSAESYEDGMFSNVPHEIVCRSQDGDMLLLQWNIPECRG